MISPRSWLADAARDADASVMAAYEVRKDRMEPLWDRVDRSRVELFVFVVLFIAFLVVAVDFMAVFAILAAMVVDPLIFETFSAALGEVLVWATSGATAMGLVYVIFALTRGERWILRTLGATIVPKGESLDTKYALKDMAIAAGFAVAPALYVMETPNVNAFVLGRPSRRGVVGVTRGLMDRMPTDEQRAVFANLLARLKAGDTIWATGVSAIMDPFWRVDTASLRASHRTIADDSAFDADGNVSNGSSMGGYLSSVAVNTAVSSGTGWLWFMAVATAFVTVAEFVAFGHRRMQLRHAELADAEGMLLLKDPAAMLHALERAVRLNNFVPTAGPGFAQLFYCWTGDDSTDDETDPENRRITRLREVLGVEGVREPEPSTEGTLGPPAAPRLDEWRTPGPV